LVALPRDLFEVILKRLATRLVYGREVDRTRLLDRARAVHPSVNTLVDRQPPFAGAF
jgi:hypothetical protein